MTQTFTIRRQVEFNHCDPAGIVFYPRYFEMISALMERFFADAIGTGWAQMGRLEGAMGTPMGDIQVRFHAPSRLEDWLDLSLHLSAIGGASATFQLRCECAGELRFTGEATVIYASLGASKATRWPDEMRVAMTRYLSSADQS
ncbi:thioesterase family protein [Pseudooceanicola sp. HF7]|uniref:acyl-CoA thioesterase n=1 Tax=Pseudooceanicola sp. HF7 TaxID=2721560 RepID=UPI001431BA3C|nr:thioesterase family protein [Pseudooceanicola sp. HF7]NIZ09355.1 acyl-CoA thioesterase [Pseudooceanicola sp. HF7]